jgi:hypothetical protein
LAAAEWSFIPLYSSSLDYDSNRRLQLGLGGTEAAVLTADLRFQWALEDSNFTLEPRYALRRFSDPSLGNGDDRSVFASFNHIGEQSTLNLNASYWEQSTLLTELLETGILSGNTHRRLAQVGENWTWNETERTQLLTQLSYQDTSYFGQGSNLLPGYRYPSGTVGERFGFSERASVTLSVYGSELITTTRGDSSREYGLQLEGIYVFSERTRVDASLGESSRVLLGQKSFGTDATATLSHDLERGNLSLNYSRSLVPYGVGFLVERQQITAATTHRINDYFDANLSLLRIDNSELAVLLGLDRRSYDSLISGINWHPTDTCTVGLQLGASHTQPPGTAGGTVNEWRTAFSLTWTPYPVSRSW